MKLVSDSSNSKLDNLWMVLLFCPYFVYDFLLIQHELIHKSKTKTHEAMQAPTSLGVSYEQSPYLIMPSD